jgi:CRISPR-associated protein Csm3
MYGKIIIKCRLKVLTGMHIGGSDAFSAIGAVDKPVVTDPRTDKPIIPGSSLKGKLRTLLARSFAGDINNMPSHNADDMRVKRLFGTSSAPIVKSRLQFSDSFVINAGDFGEIPLTEVKFENSIDRGSSVANPNAFYFASEAVCGKRKRTLFCGRLRTCSTCRRSC